MRTRRFVRVVVAGVFALALLSLTAPAAVAQEDSYDYPDGSDRIIGSPDAGPKPEDPGDRGGWAQLLTLGVIVVGVGFVGWRITRSIRAAATSDPGVLTDLPEGVADGDP